MDDIYLTAFESNDDQKLPGTYYILDYNGDGVINSTTRFLMDILAVLRIHTVLHRFLIIRDGASSFQFYGVQIT